MCVCVCVCVRGCVCPRGGAVMDVGFVFGVGATRPLLALSKPPSTFSLASHFFSHMPTHTHTSRSNSRRHQRTSHTRMALSPRLSESSAVCVSEVALDLGVAFWRLAILVFIPHFFSLLFISFFLLKSQFLHFHYYSFLFSF